MRKLYLGLALIATMTSASAQVSMAVPGAVDDIAQRAADGTIWVGGESVSCVQGTVLL